MRNVGQLARWSILLSPKLPEPLIRMRFAMLIVSLYAPQQTTVTYVRQLELLRFQVQLLCFCHDSLVAEIQRIEEHTPSVTICQGPSTSTIPNASPCMIKAYAEQDMQQQR